LEDVSELSHRLGFGGVSTRDYESDLLFVVDGVAFCVEVKAGSITEKARRGNVQRLADDLEKTMTAGNEQARRLALLIERNGGVWSSTGEWIAVEGVHELHSIVVMLDDMGPLSLSMDQLATHGVIPTQEIPWIVSLHDLMVIARTIDHPAQFLEYLRRRTSRQLVLSVNAADELDMFMWFLTGGMYLEQNPRDVAKMLPLGRPATKSAIRRYESRGRIRIGTFTDPLDAWFYFQQGLSTTEAVKPTRREQPWVERYLSFGERSGAPGWLRFGADLVSLSEESQRSIGRDLSANGQRFRVDGLEYSLTTHGTTQFGSWLLSAAHAPIGAPADHLSEYSDAKQYQTKSDRAMVLLLDPDGEIRGSRFQPTAETRTPERDDEIASAPLWSLAKTFSKPPPSARRATRRLRGAKGRRGGKNR
jgi:hypothetical protein